MTESQLFLYYAGLNPVFWILLWNNVDEAEYMIQANAFEDLANQIWEGTLVVDGIEPTPTYPRPVVNHP